jgi:hypothetical protein
MIPALDILLALVWFAALCSSVERRPAGRYVTIDGRRVPFAE